MMPATTTAREGRWRRWTEVDDALLMREAVSTDVAALASKLGRTERAVRVRLRTLSGSRPLTAREQSVLTMLRLLQGETGRAPSMRRVTSELGLSSGAASRVIRSLTRRGILTRPLYGFPVAG